MARLTFVCCFFWAGIIASYADAANRSAERPNIVLIMADDIGLRDISFHARNIQHRDPFVETPAIDELGINQDMVATFASLVGTSIPKGQAQDSHDLLPLLTAKGKFRQCDYFINQAGASQELMLRKMPWKLIIQSDFKRKSFEPMALYNLQDDPYEDSNQLSNPDFREVADGLFSSYMDIVKSG